MSRSPSESPAETSPRPARGKSLARRLRDFVYFRLRALRDVLRRRGAGWWKHRVWRRLVPYRPTRDPLRLHVGSGTERLDGWVNVDLQPLVEVDICADVTRGLPFSGVHRIFAEHFLEHLELSDAVEFLVRCHDALEDDGRLRLTTPNLSWVWSTQYGPAGHPDPALRAVAINRCFHAWGHRFLWNGPMLERALEAAGFVDLVWPEYGESDDPELRGLERHETWPDTEEHSHILIVEATKGPPRSDLLASLRATVDSELGSMLGTTHR